MPNAEPAVGNRVTTADGADLGVVKRVSDVAFLLDVRGGLDYWLNKADIEAVDAVTVRMAFLEAALEEHEIKYGDVL